MAAHQVRYRGCGRAHAGRGQRVQPAHRPQQQLHVDVRVVTPASVRRRGNQLPAERDALHQRYGVLIAVNWNPLDTGNFATGTQGLIYEPLYLYDPIRRAVRSLARDGRPEPGWKGDTYIINVRPGRASGATARRSPAQTSRTRSTWRGQNATDPYSANVSTVANAVANGNTVTVTFKGTPGYTEFTDYLWKAPVLPQHVWSKIPASQIATDANAHPVGTGPMTLDTYNAQEVAYQTKPGWWATSALGLSFKFKYLVDVVNGSNDQELGQLTAGNIDWSNNFLPGINQLMGAVGGNSGYTLKTYYPTTPYMLSANTVWLEPNDSVAPMSNVNFRKALAYALNPSAIAQTVYGGIAKAANPTGLLPNLSSYVNQGAVSSGAPTYNPAKAKQFLAQSGYKGQAITLQVPDGWSDWMDATTVIKSELDAIGINLAAHLPAGQRAHRERDQRQLRPAAGQQRRPRLHAVELLPAGVPAPDRQAADLAAELGTVQLAGGLVAGAAGRHGPAHRHL